MSDRDRLLVPISEAIWKLGMGRSKFFEIVAAGEIETVKIGRRTLVPQAALVAYVDKLRSLAPQSADHAARRLGTGK